MMAIASWQGRRHGFESGGQIFGLHFLASGVGGQNIAYIAKSA